MRPLGDNETSSTKWVVQLVHGRADIAGLAGVEQLIRHVAATQSMPRFGALTDEDMVESPTVTSSPQPITLPRRALPSDCLLSFRVSPCRRRGGSRTGADAEAHRRMPRPDCRPDRRHSQFHKRKSTFRNNGRAGIAKPANRLMDRTCGLATRFGRHDCHTELVAISGQGADQSTVCEALSSSFFDAAGHAHLEIASGRRSVMVLT